MKKSKLLLCIFLFGVQSTYSQWTSRQSLSGVNRSFSTAFAIGTKIYLAGGNGINGVLDDLWEYDTGLDSWTQKASLPFGFRSGASSFTIGYMGYLCTGTNGFAYQNDLWEYNSLTDAWAQKASFPGFPRDEAVSFVIGSSAYVGTGQQFVLGPNGSFTEVFSDFYEYNSLTDTWTSKAPIPGTGRAYAVGISDGSKGYVGLGGNEDQTISYSDFYQYDPLADTWTLKSAMPSSGRADAGIFILGVDIYVYGGINFPSLSTFSTCKKYSTVANTWTSTVSFPGGPITAPVCVAMNDTIYAGTGGNAVQAPRNDWWCFAPLVTSLVENKGANFSVYPNPFTTKINVMPTKNEGETRIELLDVQGQNVYSSVLTAIKLNTIDTYELSNGIYFLKITDNEGNLVRSEKLVKCDGSEQFEK